MDAAWQQDQIVERLWLGGFRATEKQALMDQLDISHVLSLGCEAMALPSKLVKKLYIDIEDAEDADILEHFDQAVAFIEEALAYRAADSTQGVILVHCIAGVSRSASCVIAYMMKTQQMSFEDAFRFV